MALLALVPLPALAQAYHCVPPFGVVVTAAPKQDGPTRRLATAGYTLAVSWSPEFCRSHKDNAEMQCSTTNGRFGFILHGLWPEGSGQDYPQWCSVTPRPSPAALRAQLCVTPSARLLEHEWAKHGSCVTKRPEDYFKVESALWRSLRWPDADALSKQQGLTASDLRSEFLRLNPGWQARQIGIELTRGGWLKELRLCYSLKFLPEDCPRRSRGARDVAALKVWRGL